MIETAFVQSLNKVLPSKVHHQSFTWAALAHNGTPDHYYDLDTDLWVEYKLVKSWTGGIDVNDLLSAAQKRWLLRRYTAGQNACVIVGIETKGRVNHALILPTPEDWLRAYTADEVSTKRVARSSIIPYILSRVTNACATANDRYAAAQRD